MTLNEALREAEAELTIAESPNPRLDSETLLLFALGREGDRAHLLTRPEQALDASIAESFRVLVRERTTGKPMQYITGHQEFWGLDFLVTPDVLIPRPETEHSVEAVTQIVRENCLEAPRILDVGTGSGCIAIALASMLPDAQVLAVDISPSALSVARQNAMRNGVKVEFVESDLLSALSGQTFDLIVSNPPYVSTQHSDTLQKQVRDFEPPLALWAGFTGLEIYERLIPQAQAALSSGGHLVLEIGYSLEAPVHALLPASRWRNQRTIPDLQGIPRVVIASKQ